MDTKFYVGQRVKCPLFGKGVITGIMDFNFIVIVDFDNVEMPQMYRQDGSYASSVSFLPTLEPDEPEVIEWPEGMNYLATDANGLRYFFKNKPDINETKKEWYPVEWDNTDFAQLELKPKPCQNWRESLIKREK